MLLVPTKEKGLATKAALDGGDDVVVKRIVYPTHMDKSPHQSKVYIHTFFVNHIYIFQTAHLFGLFASHKK